MRALRGRRVTSRKGRSVPRLGRARVAGRGNPLEDLTPDPGLLCAAGGGRQGQEGGADGVHAQALDDVERGGAKRDAQESRAREGRGDVTVAVGASVVFPCQPPEGLSPHRRPPSVRQLHEAGTTAHSRRDGSEGPPRAAARSEASPASTRMATFPAASTAVRWSRDGPTPPENSPATLDSRDSCDRLTVDGLVGPLRGRSRDSALAQSVDVVIPYSAGGR